MPNTTHQDTVDELIDWMKLPTTDYTLGWSAVAAYDREKTNRLLLQEYIERYGSDQFIEPIAGRFDDVDANEKIYLGGVTFDAPRLSFEDSALTSNIATLTWQGLDGPILNLQKQVYTGLDSWRIVELRYESGLSSSKLVQDIELETTVGGVDAGEVYLDIKRPAAVTTPRYTAVSVKSRQVKAAEQLHALLEQIPGDLTRFVISRLKSDPKAFFNPTAFAVRVHPSAQSTRDGSGAAEGAVLLFINSHNQDSGNFPNPSTYKYLIPRGYSATLALSKKFMLRRFIELSVQQLAPEAKITFEPSDNTPERAELTCGKLATNKLYSELKVGTMTVHLTLTDRQLDVSGSDASAQPMAVRLSEGSSGNIELQVTWKGSQGFEYYARFNTGDSWSDGEYRWDNIWNFTVELVDNDLVIKEGTHSIRHKVVPVTVRPWLQPYEVELVAHLETEVFDKQVRAVVTNAFQAALGPLNTLRLNQLLFSSEAPVALETLKMAQAPVVFGQVSPARTRFWIRPEGQGEQDAVIAGATLQLTLEDAPATPSTVQWTIKNLFDESADLGSVTGSGLNYCYQTDASLVGGFAIMRLEATATFPGDPKSYCSSVLVKVYATPVHVSPRVRLMGLSQNLQLTVAGLGTGSCAGRIDKDADDGADSTEVLISRANDDGYNFQYTSPKSTTDMEEGSNSKRKAIEYRRLAFSQAGQPDESECYAIVPYTAEELIVTVVDASEQGGQTRVTLRAYWIDDSVLDPEFEPLWSVPVGVGEIAVQGDGTAVLTLPTEKLNAFSVVEVRVLYENTFAVKRRQRLGQLSGEVAAPSKPADYIGVRLFPAPWIDIPNPTEA